MPRWKIGSNPTVTGSAACETFPSAQHLDRSFIGWRRCLDRMEETDEKPDAILGRLIRVSGVIKKIVIKKNYPTIRIGQLALGCRLSWMRSAGRAACSRDRAAFAKAATDQKRAAKSGVVTAQTIQPSGGSECRQTLRTHGGGRMSRRDV